MGNAKLRQSIAGTILKNFFLLLIIVFSFSFQLPNSPENNNHEEQFKKIMSLPDKEIEWLITIDHISATTPKHLAQMLEIGKILWANDPSYYKDAVLLITESEIAVIKDNHDVAKEKILRAIDLITASPRENKVKKKLLCLSYLFYAKLSKYIKEEVDGLNYAYKALEIANTVDFPTGEALLHNQIGLLIDYTKGDDAVSLEHYLKAEALIPIIPIHFRNSIKSFVLNNLALKWSETDSIKKSITMRIALNETLNTQQNIPLTIVNNNNLGTSYYQLKEYALAEKYLQKALDLMNEHKIYSYKGIPLLRRGLIQLEKGNVIKATNYADSIDYWLLNHQFVGKFKIKFYQFKSKIAKAKSDFEQAISWLDSASIEQEKTNKELAMNSVLKLESSIQLSAIKQDKLVLEKELAANKAIIDAQNIKLLAISFITILSIWFGIAFYLKTKELKEAYNFILRKNSSPPTIKAPVNTNTKTNTKINKALKEKIIHALEVDKIYLSSDLTLKKFSDQLSSNTSYVSQTINEGFRKNFSTLLNEYRVKEVLLFFEEGEHQTFTIESLYKKAGFKSKSSFQKAFKNSTGVTASHYLEHLSNFQKKS